MTIKHKISHLQTPEVRVKRAKAIRAAFARKRKEARVGKGDVGTALIPLDAIPDRVTPARQVRRATKRTEQMYTQQRVRLIAALIVAVSGELAGREEFP